MEVDVVFVVAAEKRLSSRGRSSPRAERLDRHPRVVPPEAEVSILFCSICCDKSIFIMMRQVQYAKYIGGSSALQVEYFREI